MHPYPSPCLNAATLTGLPLPGLFELAAKAGFGGVEIPIQQVQASGPAKVASLLAEHGITVPAASGILPAGPVVPAPLLVPEPAYTECLTGLHDRLFAYERVGCTTATLVINPRCRLQRSAAMEVASRRLTDLAEAAAQHGVRIAVEAVSATARLGPELEGPRQFIGNLAELAGLLDGLTIDVGVCLDSFHWFASGASAEEIRALADRIVHVQVADAPGSVTRDDLSDDQRLFPGDGALPWRRLRGALSDAGYVGAVSVELFNPQLRRLPDDEIAQRAIDSVLRWWP